MFEYTFPADFSRTYKGQPLAGMQCTGLVIEDLSEDVEALIVELRGVFPHTGRAGRILIRADVAPGLMEVARQSVLDRLALSETHGAGWPINANTQEGMEIRLGNIVPIERASIPCTVRCQQRVDGSGEFRGSVFAVVDHPTHGRIAVDPVERLALGLPDVPGIH